jgi:hypothetical protein
VILADAYQALLRYGHYPFHLPAGIHRFRGPRARDAYALVAGDTGTPFVPIDTCWTGCYDVRALISP